MQLLRERDVPANEHDRVFRYSRTFATIAYALVLVAPMALFVTGVRHHLVLPPVIAMCIAMLVFLAKRFLVARFRPSNWLVRATESGVYVKFRSYLNYHFSADDRYEAIQELDRPALERRIAELARAGKMREARLQTRLHFAYDSDETSRFIERLLGQPDDASAPRRETA